MKSPADWLGFFAQGKLLSKMHVDGSAIRRLKQARALKRVYAG